MTIFEKLKAVEPFRWFNVKDKKINDLTEFIKRLIDDGEHFEFSDDYTKFRRLEDYFLHNN
jgi:hypothetical protein